MPQTYRHLLRNGAVIYIAEDHSVPLVDIRVHIKTGGYLDPPGKAGLAAMTGSQLRAGGTLSRGADKFDEDVAVLAADIRSSISATEGSARLNCLARNISPALALFLEMLRSPRFQADRMDLYRERALESMRSRNDDIEQVETREWIRLMRGDGHFATTWSNPEIA